MPESVDYVIVGGGPTGLTLAWYLARAGKSVRILERERELGGCHRVERVGAERWWTEHGPRIYSRTYVNTRALLAEMGLEWDALFTPYRVGISDILTATVGGLSARELAALAWAFLQLPWRSENYKRVSVFEFAGAHGFSAESIDTLDRYCRLTDGAGAERYTLYEFLQLANFHTLPTGDIVEPRLPNDVALIAGMARAVASAGAEVRLGEEVTAIQARGTGYVVNQTSGETLAQHCILAIPPKNAAALLGGAALSRFAQESAYIDYLSMSFHWAEDVAIPDDLWGAARGDWGVAWIKQSAYMDFANPGSTTVISAAATIGDVPSRATGKTANQSSEQELIAETLRQLQETTGPLPRPTKALLSPGVTHDGRAWRSRDTAWVLTPRGGDWQNFELAQGLYSVGPHNGHSPYPATSFEAAVSNALVFLNKHAQGVSAPRPSRQLTVWDVLWLLIGIAIVLLLYRALKH